MSSCMSIISFENRLRDLKQPYSSKLIVQMRNIILRHKGLPCEFVIKGKDFGCHSISDLLIELGFYNKDLDKKQFQLSLSHYSPNDFISYGITINKACTK